MNLLIPATPVNSDMTFSMRYRPSKKRSPRRSRAWTVELNYNGPLPPLIGSILTLVRHR
jgi:hypothetical protein